VRAALPVALLLAAACGPDERAAREERSQVREVRVLTQSAGGPPAWTLRTPRAILREEARLADLEEPRMEFYRDGKAVSRVSARTGLAEPDTRVVRLSSGVVLDSLDDRSRLTTEELSYSPSEDRLVTKADILVSRPEGTVRGRGLTAKPDLSEIRIYDQKTVYAGSAR
jgi:LPS export ABC transporter protein LptC